MTTPNLPALTLKTDFSDDTTAAVVHAKGHNDVATAVLQHRTAIGQLSSSITTLQAAVSQMATDGTEGVSEAEFADLLERVDGISAEINLAFLAAVLDPLIVGTITRNANGAATSAGVLWPDGSTGTYTATTLSTEHPGAVDAYTVTKVTGAVTTTFTQPAVTRDANGAVTQRPAITVT